jgi:undecaprenyl phosphate N,N'-diacetylbacillosamine 1-phosphate transferase
MIYRGFFKRLIDFLVSFTAFMLLLPIFLIISICLMIHFKGSPFFYQERPGKGAKAFQVIKFKTMSDARDSQGNLLPDDLRLTSIGSFLRKTSLDEIPQLINVITGKMSLIGPRPLLMEYLPLYSETQARRHEVRPGITGWAQVNGRNLLDWKNRFKLDVWYIDNLTFALDLKIIYLTLIKVVKKEGVSSENYVTMEKFQGNGID